MAGGRKPFVPKGLSAGQSRSARAISGSGGPERCDRGGSCKGEWRRTQGSGVRFDCGCAQPRAGMGGHGLAGRAAEGRGRRKPAGVDRGGAAFERPPSAEAAAVQPSRPAGMEKGAVGGGGRLWEIAYSARKAGLGLSGIPNGARAPWRSPSIPASRCPVCNPQPVLPLLWPSWG
ncbi:MAG: hypothetical protein NZ840_11735 [Anaerolineales bacterium]|nr:hypothetical protein [Anaerolineales bacterium]MDW8162705.1 hypothetical protein [Anaerolineales bacterium]